MIINTRHFKEFLTKHHLKRNKKKTDLIYQLHSLHRICKVTLTLTIDIFHLLSTNKTNKSERLCGWRISVSVPNDWRNESRGETPFCVSAKCQIAEHENLKTARAESKINQNGLFAFQLTSPEHSVATIDNITERRRRRRRRENTNRSFLSLLPVKAWTGK